MSNVVKGNDNLKEFSSENSELVSITVNNNGDPIVFGKGAGGSSYSTIGKTVTKNGTYNAEDDNCDAYSSVIVDVKSRLQDEKSIVITQYGETTVTPDAGYDAISKVNLTLDSSITPYIVPLTEYDENLFLDGIYLRYKNTSDEAVNIKGGFRKKSYDADPSNTNLDAIYNLIEAGDTDYVCKYGIAYSKFNDNYSYAIVTVLNADNSKVLKTYIIKK